MVSSQVGDAGVLVHLQSNRIYEVNATGLRIWELAGNGRALGEIADSLGREFDGDAAHMDADLLALVEEFSREGLIEPDAGSGNETA